jgi:hypothetical protein
MRQRQLDCLGSLVRIYRLNNHIEGIVFYSFIWQDLVFPADRDDQGRP